jgi:hypothetical protein
VVPALKRVWARHNVLVGNTDRLHQWAAVLDLSPLEPFQHFVAFVKLLQNECENSNGLDSRLVFTMPSYGFFVEMRHDPEVSYAVVAFGRGGHHNRSGDVSGLDTGALSKPLLRAI